jgi:hypothetical protein
MWKKTGEGVRKVRTKKVLSALVGACIVGLLLAGCGGSGGAINASMAAPASNSSGQSAIPSAHQAAASSNGAGSGQKASSSGQYAPQYLAKSLQVTMDVQDTSRSASFLQQWVEQDDSQATSDGTDYEQVGDNQYNVTLTFLIDSSHYDQVESYLRDYAGQKGNTLISLKETVQDETSDYVDAQSTLTNLRAEQQRLLTFMNEAQNMSDALSIEQQLTQVEGQIDQIEGQLNALKSQTTFYTVTIILQPVGSAPPPPAQSSPWSVIPVWQGAWSAVVNVWHVLATLIVWLLAFSVYIVPIGIIAWLVRKKVWRRTRLPRFMPAMPASMAQPKDGETD